MSTMFTVKVNLNENSYDIVVGSDILGDLGKAIKALKIGRDAIVITNPVVKRLHGKKLTTSLKKAGLSVKFLEVPDGERSKSVKTAFRLIDKIAAYNIKKEVFVIAFGGGVIGDLAGFVAAIYKRGVPFVQVPTTFLAQIDSAIGGKVAVDLPTGKNLVGSFYQPKLVYSDVTLLSTLTKRQVRNGLAEAIKYGIICEKFLFDYIEQNIPKVFSFNPRVLSEIVYNCSSIKARVVMNDEKETKGVRTILNFGHTAGHAVEAASKFRYHHGESVALGMCIAADISRRLKLIGKKEVDHIENVLGKIGLPAEIKKISFKKIMSHMQHDKKFKAGKNRFVLATSIGSVKVLEGIDQRIIASAIKAYMG